MDEYVWIDKKHPDGVLKQLCCNLCKHRPPGTNGCDKAVSNVFNGTPRYEAACAMFEWDWHFFKYGPNPGEAADIAILEMAMESSDE